MNSKKAFSLIELMVAMGVIAVLATLSVVAIQTIQRSLRDTQRRDVINTSNLAMSAYMAGNGNVPPPTADVHYEILGTENVLYVDIGSNNDYLSTVDFKLASLGSTFLEHTETTANNSDATTGNNTNYCYHTSGGEYIFGVQLEDTTWFYVGPSGLKASCTTNTNEIIDPA